jgi:hypothetical protein
MIINHEQARAKPCPEGERSRSLGALGGQAAVVALNNRAPIEDSVAVISRKLSVSSRPLVEGTRRATYYYTKSTLPV